MGSRRIPNIVHIEQDQGTQFGASQRLLNLPRPIGPKPGKVNPLLPIGSQRRSRGSDSHGLRSSIVILDHDYLLGIHYHGTTSRFLSLSPGGAVGVGLRALRSAAAPGALPRPPYTGAYSPTSAGRVGERGLDPGRSSTDQAASTMCCVDRPYLVNRYGASRAPSAKVSARPIRRNGRPRPDSASTSATAEPRPPMMVWFSAVTTALAARATERTVAVSRSLMTGMFTTTVTTPAVHRTRAAASAGATIMPLTSRATSGDGATPEPEYHPPSEIPAPPRVTPPPLLTPPPSVSA